MRTSSSKLLPVWALVIALASTACAQAPQQGGDHDVTLKLINNGSEPLRCSIVFGHWVYRELGVLPPGQGRDIIMLQATKDGALYIPRFDGERQMMIENLICGRLDNWRDSLGQFDLAPVRSTRVTEIAAQCAAPEGPGRVICEASEIMP